jgi:HAMP domain-containing protein
MPEPMSSSERPGPVPSSRWQRLRLLQPLNRESLRYQFTVAILGVLLPAFAISYAVVNHLAVRQITAITKTRLRIQAELISSGLRKWEDSTRTSLTAISFDRALRERDVAASQALLNSLQTIYPGREWRFWSADPQPRLLAATGQVSEEGRRQAEARILKREYFRQALSGRPSYSVVRSYLNNQYCLMVAQPVYPRLRHGSSAVSRPLSSQSQFVQQHLTAGLGGQKPNGVLISCIKLRDIAIDTGLKTALADSQLDPAAASSDLFDSKKPFTSAFLLVSRQGHVLYPTVENYNGRIPMVTDFLKGPWAPLMGLAQRAQRGDESFGRVQIHANRYFVLTNRADTAWSTMLIVNETEIFSALNHLMRSLVIFGVISVLLAAGAIYWQCGRLISPIRQAGRALDRISTGDFDVRIPPQRSDEIGTLLANINQTAQKLRLFLSHETAHAVTQKQLETAREIQKDFLVEVIPSSPQFELAALSEPAYDVGADWYDALVVDGITYVVVADVCDKGIPSALYMSVFRSLLRYGLLAGPIRSLSQ